MDKLDEIAFKHGNGNRAFGLPGYAASVDYIWSHVGNATGATAWKQDFPAWFSQVQSISLKVDGEETYVHGLSYSPSTSEEGLTAELVLGPEGEAGCSADNYDGIDVEGKIVLTQRFRCPTGGTLAGRVLPAAQRGAAAVIIYSDVSTKPTAGSLGEVALDKYVPAGYIYQKDGEAIKERLEAGEKIEAYFQQTQTVEERITQNVFVETEEGDPNNVIMVRGVDVSPRRDPAGKWMISLTSINSSVLTSTVFKPVPASMMMVCYKRPRRKTARTAC